jgi:hypothetical protein
VGFSKKWALFVVFGWPDGGEMRGKDGQRTAIFTTLRILQFLRKYFDRAVD